MSRLSVFNSVSLDGYFVDKNNSINWAHGEPDAEFDAFVGENASSGGPLLLGRVTYDMMASYWPTPQAKKDNGAVADGINATQKVVVSKSLKSPTWANTRVISDDLPGEVRRMKKASHEGITILGSGTLVAQLTQEKLVDEFQFVVVPVVLGIGRSMFEGLTDHLSLKLTRSRIFANGKSYLCYQTRA